VAQARDELSAVLAMNGPETSRPLQRAIRDTMTARAGVVRDGDGLRRGLSELTAIEERLAALGVHPDLAGFQDVAHAFDLRAATLAARATLEAALERRETRGCHNRADYPRLDPTFKANIVWSGPGRLTREPIPDIPNDISALMREVSSSGKLLE
jgi:succinate dehydrogenase / fumarate reductase flavoprotein subunit